MYLIFWSKISLSDSKSWNLVESSSTVLWMSRNMLKTYILILRAWSKKFCLLLLIFWVWRMGNFNQQGFTKYSRPHFKFFWVTSTWSYFLLSFMIFRLIREILDQNTYKILYLQIINTFNLLENNSRWKWLRKTWTGVWDTWKSLSGWNNWCIILKIL